ncbi:hypothetical protein SLS62_006911 [Diatrype stigma]|uniref:DUF6594 domain-containing protein n=1 Tax=Diatrype stigma TaxID=117547 RepID=A0AAN9YQR4_9PEZI
MMEADIEAQRPGPGAKSLVPEVQNNGADTGPHNSLVARIIDQGHKLLNEMRESLKSQPQPNNTPNSGRDRITVDGSLNGYPKLGAFVASNENYLIFRQFKYLQSRLLLNMQDQLREYETELISLERDYRVTGVHLQCRERDDHKSGRRKLLMQKIEERYEKYSQYAMFLRDM